MIGLRRFLLSEPGKILISIILGLGLSTLFRKACNDQSCISFLGVHPNNIEEKVFKFNEKCYKYTNEAVTCDASKKHLMFDTQNP